MSHVTYQVVQHDGGWAYKVDGVFSEPFPTHAEALAAARTAAAEQRVPGHSEVIEYEDEHGKWHTENAPWCGPSGNRCGRQQRLKGAPRERDDPRVIAAFRGLRGRKRERVTRPLAVSPRQHMAGNDRSLIDLGSRV